MVGPFSSTTNRHAVPYSSGTPAENTFVATQDAKKMKEKYSCNS